MECLLWNVNTLPHHFCILCTVHTDSAMERDAEFAEVLLAKTWHAGWLQLFELSRCLALRARMRTNIFAGY